jgi:hypothetical protein
MSEFIEMIPECGRTSFTLRDRAGKRKRETAVSALQARQLHLEKVREPATGSLGRAGWVRIELAPNMNDIPEPFEEAAEEHRIFMPYFFVPLNPDRRSRRKTILPNGGVVGRWFLACLNQLSGAYALSTSSL